MSKPCLLNLRLEIITEKAFNAVSSILGEKLDKVILFDSCPRSDFHSRKIFHAFYIGEKNANYIQNKYIL